MVQFFEPNSRSNAYRLNDVKFEVLPEDFDRKVKDPQLVAVGRSRANYVFYISLRPCLYYLHFFMNSFDYKDFSSAMIFFDEVLFTSYCCVRYFHKRKI